ncbi:hypothetical protein D9Q98_007574 [Chlorella vulgaris]|uniref:peptidylprolyl isomerase n=1 Tax=Chlorella vulgaris TaxID=3077 RepID=A0A9D4TLU4_CHLVU|nr:hypothetical protein D9Q98_007574 [Chlorella vulgaris]
MATLRLPAAFQATISQNVWRRRSRPAAGVAAAARPGGGDTAVSPPLPQLSRRQLQAAVLAAVLASQAAPAQALGFKKEMKKRNIPAEDYTVLEAEPGLRYYELAVGNGQEAKLGSRVFVHFECKYRGLYVVSTRSARTLGGNRTVAEPFEFVVGGPVVGPGVRTVESAGGLFAGGGGPKPPLGLSKAVVGMRTGGKRSLLVPAELGYGSQGEQEIPPNCDSIELRIELLSVA